MDGTAVLHRTVLHDAVLCEQDASLCEVAVASREARQIVTADGYSLSADLFIPAATPRGIIVIAGAVGVPQRFYSRFAEQARVRGYQVVTFDYRGIGRSAPKTLRGFNMDFRDWGQLDLAAVVEVTADDAEQLDIPLYVVGHSFGGHAFGMLPNHQRVRACFMFGIGAGWHGWMPRAEQVRVLALWNIVGPILTLWKKYLSWSMIGMGEDLPLNVYHQWRRWCRYPHFFFDDPVIGNKMRALFSRVETRILATSAIDDRWCPPRSRDAFLKGYNNADITTMNLDPRDAQVRSLGHMGYFRSQASALWPLVFDFFESV